MGFKPEVKPLAFFQDDYGLEVGEGEAEIDGMDTDGSIVSDEGDEDGEDMTDEEK